jgi:hypothetical protein
MHISDPLSTNIFGRLFSYTPRSDAREPIEDFCTEALAWCLLDCRIFADKFLNLLRGKLAQSQILGPKFQRFKQDIDVGTQISFAADPNDEEPDDDGKGSSRGRFDLVIQPEVGDDFVIVVESKVHFDRSIGSQLADYAGALRKNPRFRHYPDSERYVIALTPWTLEASTQYARVLWPEIHELLDGSASPKHPVLHQFAEFLKSRNLSKLKLMRLKAQQLEQLQRITPFFDDATDLLGRFQNEPKLRAIFKSHWERPIINYESATNSTWYGIYTGNRNPWVYAGFWLKPAEILLYVQFMVDGDRRAWTKEFPADLAEAITDAARFKRTEIEKGRTSFYFTKKLAPDLFDQPERIFNWFKATLETAEEFLQKRIKTGVP